MRRAIENRISRRKFEKEPVTSSEKKIIISLINELNEASGLAMAFLEDGSNAFQKLRKSYGLFTNVRSVILMKGNKELKNLKERIGYYGEDLVLAITDLGLGTCWVGGTFDKEELIVDDSEELVCVVLVGKVAAPSLTEKMMRSATHRKVKNMAERIISDQPVPQWVQNGMKAVLLAPSAKNTQKAMFKYENNILSAQIADDYSLDLTDLGIAKKHFELEAGGTFEFGNGGVFRLS
ncbi:nitroreductase family protein [Desulfosporosinus sp. PR]|uniref:nitroreductase family protein n=1 Tax=Candidatus Desulfosporosinus nitrosoreducens TaxID=3401928 RepID=UPI0027F0E1DD|nr:nitroreductase family protein [Desulfosporosinus sp. PR]MDQ7094401.1 nitroreductase family protein [Desulfosporosinus sp. PR]